MTTTTNLWPILSFLANVFMALVIFSMRSALKIAVYELKEFMSEKYATKEYVDQQVDVAARINEVRTDVRRILRVMPGDAPQPGGTR